jgi:uncharacterized protein YndB with AHSA1/START domain
MEDAELLTGATRPVIRFERLLRRPRPAVWRALTDREELNSWFPCDIVTDEWRVGASLRFVFREGEWHDLFGTVLECDEPATLAFTWGDETLRFELSEVEGGTRPRDRGAQRGRLGCLPGASRGPDDPRRPLEGTLRGSCCRVHSRRRPQEGPPERF